MAKKKPQSNKRQKRIFVASLATETNTFIAQPTDLVAFRQGLYAKAGEHPTYPTLCSAPIVVARQYAADYNWKLIEGDAYWAEPGGLVETLTYETLRDRLLSQAQKAMPLDAVILGLHGAMVAADYDDCEGDLLSRMRSIVGEDCCISAEMDPHGHLTDARLRNCDLITHFKEFPHTDFVQAGQQLIELTQAWLTGSIQPTHSVFDCRMVDIFPTSHQPMKNFVAKIRRLEKEDSDILTISLIHGFMAADVAEMGAKVLVTTHRAAAKGDKLAEQLGQEFFALRGLNMLGLLPVEEAVAKATQCAAKPVVLADVWDNPGGGMPGDSTYLIHYLRNHRLKNIAVSAIWDPAAVAQCLAAGSNKQIQLQFGGNHCPESGKPISAQVTIKRLAEETFQSFGQSSVSLGSAAVVELDGIEIIIHSHRTQTYEPDAFSNLGIDPLAKDILVVKSTNHFYHGFAKITDHIYYVNAPTCYPNDPRTTPYQKVRHPLWPADELEWQEVIEQQAHFAPRYKQWRAQAAKPS